MAAKWTLEETEEFLRYAKKSLNHQERYSVEKKLRDGTEHAKEETSSTCKGEDTFRKNRDDIIGESISELWNSDHHMITVVQEALENAVTSYERVKSKGLKDGLQLPEQVDKQILSASWKQAFMKSLTKASVLKIQGICGRRARDGVFCAISEKDYSTLEPEVISSLMNDGVGVSRNYASINQAAITREMEFMQYNGVFNKIEDTGSVYERCSVLWLKADYLSPQRQKETLRVVNKLISVPYELCKKCKLMLQIMQFLRVVLLSNGNSRIKKHRDSLEAGVQFTVLYIASILQGETVYLTLDVAGVPREIRLEVDMLVILRSDVAYEIKPVAGKLFLISAMITGAL